MQVKKEFDVVTCGDEGDITVHDARMKADMRHREMYHRSFRFDAVFHEGMNNDQVYRTAASPLVEPTFLRLHSFALVSRV